MDFITKLPRTAWGVNARWVIVDRLTKSALNIGVPKGGDPVMFGDFVLLKVYPLKQMIHYRKRGKVGHRYIGPFRVIARVGKIAYLLELPAELSQIHNTFRVFELRKCVADERQWFL